MTTAPAVPITACLLHADYHRMDRECWGVVLDWQNNHLSLPERQRRNDYQAAVERAILNHVRED